MNMTSLQNFWKSDRDMKKFVLAFCLVAFCAACGPVKHIMPVEMRHPSKSGVELAGKIVSIVCLEGENPSEDSFAQAMADGFAYTLEQDYGLSEGSVGVYRMRREEGAEYATKDSMISLLMDTGSDVVFLIDTVSFGTMSMGGSVKVAKPSSADSSYMNTGAMPFKVTMHCFDAMDQKERVQTFGGSSWARPDVYSNGKAGSSVLIRRAFENLAEEAWDAGVQVASPFLSQWKTEQFSILYYDSQKWYDALEKAIRYDWKGAMDIWLTMLRSPDSMRKASAEYNLAVACFMLGDCPLAIEWLDQADKDNKLPISDTLRKRIQARM